MTGWGIALLAFGSFLLGFGLAALLAAAKDEIRNTPKAVV